MRITNSMISNNSSIHIANAKTELMKRDNQYTTQKKIQRPSDDPTVAIRSLQLRTTYAQIGQYVEKNVQDAMDWMDSTESAIENVDSILTYMKGYLNQGANDDLDVKQRNSILSVLKEYANSVFSDNANQDYSGRYLFTGHRTDTSLLFPENTTNLNYTITEHLDSESINSISIIKSGATYVDGKTAAEYAKEVPSMGSAYMMQLAYDKCEDDAPVINLTKKGATTSEAINVVSVSSADPNAYDIAAYNAANGTTADALFFADTGEIVLSENTYKKIHEEQSDIAVTYKKNTFEKEDIRPEMYFECTSYNEDSKRTLNYADPTGQEIKYEVNFTQKATVNTQAKDAFSTDIYRVVDYIERLVEEADDVDQRISEIQKKIDNTPEANTDELAAYNKCKEMLETEKSMRKTLMTQAFGMGLAMVDRVGDQVNVSLADLGTRYKRMELTYDKLSDQYVDTEGKMSDNEDVDIAEAYINLTQADNLYQASLSATSKILGNSLLNYI